MMAFTPSILFVSPITPYPQDAGVKIRIRNVLEAVADAGNVDFVGYTNVNANDHTTLQAQLNSLNSICRSVRLIPSPSWRGIGRIDFSKILERLILSKTPAYYKDFPHEALVSMAEPLADQSDLIWVERLYVAHWLRHYGNKTIVDIDDLESVKLKRQMALGTGVEQGLYGVGQRSQVAKLMKSEQHAAGRFLRIVTCSGQDRDRWPSEKHENIWVIPNGTDDSLLSLPRGQKIPHQMIFVGTMDYPPNEDAIIHFCQTIFPLVLKEIPDATLRIVGRNPSTKVMDLADGEVISVHANVPDVAEFVQKASVSVVPLRVGGGTRLKILESLALGTPVVSTAMGAEGLNLRHDRHLLIANRPEEFAAQTTALLRDEQMRDRLASAGAMAIRNSYCWSSIRRQLTEQLQLLLKAPRHTAKP